jgi:hypothetical protein
LEWESRELNEKFVEADNCCKADESLKSFVFILKNLHNIPMRMFALKAGKKDQAIYCYSDSGLHFGDIGIMDNWNGLSYTHSFGDRYMNNTGLDGRRFFTGSANFNMKEIEVFKITN